MTNIEKLKIILGVILISFPILAGTIFFLESFGILNKILGEDSVSMIFQNGLSIARPRIKGSAVGGGTSNVTIFFGFCGIAGAYLLAGVKSNKICFKE